MVERQVTDRTLVESNLTRRQLVLSEGKPAVLGLDLDACDGLIRR